MQDLTTDATLDDLVARLNFRGVIHDETLAANAATWTIAKDLSNIPLLRVLGIWRVVGVGAGAGQKFDRIRLQFNGDTTAGHYDYGVNNSDLTSAEGTDATETSILISHAATSESDANLYAFSVLEIPFPGETTLLKHFTSRWSYTGNADGSGPNPLGTQGMGIWFSTAAITSLKFFPQDDASLLAGCRVVLLEG